LRASVSSDRSTQRMGSVSRHTDRPTRWHPTASVLASHPNLRAMPWRSREPAMRGQRHSRVIHRAANSPSAASTPLCETKGNTGAQERPSRPWRGCSTRLTNRTSGASALCSGQTQDCARGTPARSGTLSTLSGLSRLEFAIPDFCSSFTKVRRAVTQVTFHCPGRSTRDQEKRPNSTFARRRIPSQHHDGFTWPGDREGKCRARLKSVLPG
jgi:hypothetical protein